MRRNRSEGKTFTPQGEQCLQKGPEHVRHIKDSFTRPEGMVVKGAGRTRERREKALRVGRGKRTHREKEERELLLRAEWKCN